MNPGTEKTPLSTLTQLWQDQHERGRYSGEMTPNTRAGCVHIDAPDSIANGNIKRKAPLSPYEALECC